MPSYDVPLSQPVVIDNGTGTLKAGFSGEQNPKFVLPTCIGKPKHQRVMMGALEGDLFVGNRMIEHRGLLKLHYPMNAGVIVDWDSMEYLWQHLYSKDQLNISSDDHPVLLTESSISPTRNREKMASIFFESFNVPALLISSQPILSLYATGRTTGVVLDCGEGIAQAVPVYEGFALQHSTTRSDLGGRDVTRFMKLLLRREGYNFYTSSEFEIIRTMKEKTCYVSGLPLKDEVPQYIDKTSYVLPDGSQIELGSCRYQAPEILFRPEIIGLECEGVQQILLDSIRRSDLDLRPSFYSNIVISGGSTLFKGFGDRILYELKKNGSKDVRIRISARSDRVFATWIGGSVLASVESFKRIWITNREYSEEGSRILHRKMF